MAARASNCVSPDLLQKILTHESVRVNCSEKARLLFRLLAEGIIAAQLGAANEKRIARQHGSGEQKTAQIRDCDFFALMSTGSVLTPLGMMYKNEIPSHRVTFTDAKNMVPLATKARRHKKSKKSHLETKSKKPKITAKLKSAKKEKKVAKAKPSTNGVSKVKTKLTKSK